jgi:hypothetical protein
MEKIVLIFQLALIYILFSQCIVDSFDTRLTIINKTSQTIFIDISKDGYFNKAPISVDTVKRDTIWDNMRWTPPMDSSSHIPPSLGSWEKYVNEKCKDSVLTIFIFDEQLLKSVSQDSLITNQICSEKYLYKVKDLERLNWRIEYRK